MKKIIILLSAALIFAGFLIPASAVRDWVEPVGDVYVPFVTTPPTLDGVISEGEWCENASFIINDWNMIAVYTFGFMELPEGWSAKVNLAWDSRYLYIATQCKDPTTVGRIEGKEGDYFRMYLDFGYAQDGMDVSCSFAWCLVKDEENGGDLTTKTLFLIDGQSSGEWCTGEAWGAAGAEGDYWIFEGRVPWNVLLEVYEANTGTKVTPDVGTEATGLIYYVDFDETFSQINWFGTSLYGYDVNPWFGTSGFGINISFVGSESDVKPRPETTEPSQTEPPVVSEEPTSSAEDTQNPPASSTENNNPDTSAPTTQKAGENDKNGGLPTGAIIGIAAGAAVVIAGGAAIIFSKKKKA